MLPDTPPPSPNDAPKAAADSSLPGDLTKKTSMRDMLKNRGISVDHLPKDQDPLCDDDTEDKSDNFWIAFDNLEDLKQAIENRSVNIQEKCSVSITKDGKTITIHGTPSELIRKVSEILAEDAANTEDPQQSKDKCEVLTVCQATATAIDEVEETNRMAQSLAASIVINSRRQNFAEPQPASAEPQTPEPTNPDNISEFNDEEAQQPSSFWQRLRSCLCCGPKWRSIK